MIRLVSLESPSQANNLSTTSPNHHRHKSSGLSPEIRLRPKVKKVSTFQPGKAQQIEIVLKSSHQPTNLSFIGQKTSQTVDEERVNTSTIKWEAKQETSFTYETPSSGFLLNNLKQCERQSPQKQRPKRQIVKLRHRKRMSHSPIDKLVPLLGNPLEKEEFINKQ